MDMVTKEQRERIEHQFDAFCVHVLSNASRRLRTKRRRLMAKETLMEPLEIDRQYSALNITDSDMVHGHQLDPWTYALLSDLIAEALDSLDEEQRAIILRYYFLNQSDYQIADQIDLARRTVTRRRVKALAALRAYLDRGEDDDE